MPQPPPLSPSRAKLASFDHAYAIAIQLRELSGVDQFAIRTGDPLQPVRITQRQPANDETIMALVA